ncbi:DNA-binding transcriptional regulator, MarR family [Paenibacillus sp. 1_12]|uniref:MarR family transcriptional regulator n=1 Tax=Paenibacillus sp. 1_12 TaxID=1566278 RepID=UPI0008E6A275|nr:MarR family transcriptional regulator [Paenibacillus sp. 1_12]SFK83236.1 DNA-binding transcriptional regulator, MarR family [Paenibacillus sp. 1_12]
MNRDTRGGFYISQIKQLGSRIFEKLLKDNDIEDFNGAQGRILFVLWQKDNLPISELGEKTSLAKTTLTSMLDRMAEQGHIQRNHDPKDRRQTLITLTDKAKLLSNSYDVVSDQMNQLFYKGFSDEEMKQLDTMLVKVLHNLKEYEE